MHQLSQAHCEPCQAGGKALNGEEISTLLPQLAGWRIEISEGVAQLVKSYAFGNFSQALAFTNRIGELAEAEDHHPALLTEWGKVTVRWWTHALSGLHRNDFIMAARTELLAGQAPGVKPA